MPIFHDGALVAWIVVGRPSVETGGKEPGGEIITAVSRHDEGMKLTPIKIGENYGLRTDLLMMMENFISRAPRMQVTDVKARVAACDRIRMRVAGDGATPAAAASSRACSEDDPRVRGGRAETHPELERRRLPSRRLHRHHGAEARPAQRADDGDQEGRPADHRPHRRLPEHEGSFQALGPGRHAAHCAVNLYSFPFHRLPDLGRDAEPVDFVIPHGTIMDPDPEAAISCSPITASAVFPLLACDFSKMMLTVLSGIWFAGSASSNASAPMISCTNQHGVRIVDFMGFPLNGWGYSARHDCDGVDVVGFPHCPWGKQPDVEDIEHDFPVLHLYQKMLPNTCGFGKYRGGVGAAIAYVTQYVPTRS